MTTLGEEFRAAREARSLKRKDVCDIVSGITVAQLTRIETRGVVSPVEEKALRAFFEGQTIEPKPDKVEDEVIDDDKPVGRPGRKGREKRPPLTRSDFVILRFKDGAVVDPSTCPRNIHARFHWVWDAVTETATCVCALETKGKEA